MKHKRKRVAVNQYDDFLIQKVIMDPGQTWNKIRTVHNYKTHYRKHWNYTDPEWFYPHLEIVNKLILLMPSRSKLILLWTINV